MNLFLIDYSWQSLSYEHRLSTSSHLSYLRCHLRIVPRCLQRHTRRRQLRVRSQHPAAFVSRLLRHFCQVDGEVAFALHFQILPKTFVPHQRLVPCPQLLAAVGPRRLFSFAVAWEMQFSGTSSITNPLRPPRTRSPTRLARSSSRETASAASSLDFGVHTVGAKPVFWRMRLPQFLTLTRH